MPLRSITKSFVVTLCLQSVDAGLIFLNAPLGAYIAGIPNGDRITLEMLAAMMSGNSDYVTQQFLDDFTVDLDALFTSEDLIDYVRQGQPLFEPGTQRVYVNADTVLLAAVMNAKTNEPLESALRTKSFAPLGLEQTRYVTLDF